MFNLLKGSISYLKNVKIELSNITWPKLPEIFQALLVISVVTIISALFFTFFDKLFIWIITSMINFKLF